MKNLALIDNSGRAQSNCSVSKKDLLNAGKIFENFHAVATKISIL